jgi:glutathione S-transferase
MFNSGDIFAPVPISIRQPTTSTRRPAMDANRFEIVSSMTCPFAQRTRMALLEKGIPFSVAEISLDDKPDWFLAISPYSKVPLLRDGDAVIFESAVIGEYLEEVCPEPPLMPADPVARAKVRIWVDFANVRFIPHVYKLMMAQDAADQEHRAGLLLAAIRRMEEHLASADAGAFWIGDRLTYADLSFYPHLERFCAVEHYRGVNIPDDCQRLRGWLAMMSERPSARKVARDPDVLIRNWGKYARGGGDGATARDMRDL